MHVTIPEAITYITRSMVVITFVISIRYLNSREFDHRLVLSILLVSAVNECSIPLLAGTNFPLMTSQSILLSLHQMLWLALISRFWKRHNRQSFLVGISIFALMDFVLIEGFGNIACYTVVLTSLCYLVAFAVHCVNLLRTENLEAFVADRFILLSVPLMFFFGMSAILGFRSNPLSTTEIQGVQLYKIVNFTANLMYYPMLMTYIYRQHKAHVV